MENVEKSEIVNIDLKQLVYDITKYGWDGPVEDDMLKAIEELKSLRSENEKLRKVCEAADKNANRDLTYEEHALRQALKEWKGKNGK